MFLSRAGLVTLLKGILEQRDKSPERGRLRGTFMNELGFVIVPDLASSGWVAQVAGISVGVTSAGLRRYLPLDDIAFTR